MVLVNPSTDLLTDLLI